MSDLITNNMSSYYTDSTYSAAATSKTSSLEKTLASGDLSGATDEELMSVCKDFESYFVEQVFKSMQKMIPKSEDEDSSASTDSMLDYYKDELMSQYASTATESNGGEGLGIAKTLYEQMKRTYSVPTVE